MKVKTYKRLRNAAAILLAVFVLLFGAGIFLLVASATVDGDARTLPSYPRQDLAPILSKERALWTDEDYRTVSLQTGILLKEAVDRESNDSLLSFQDALFFEGKTVHGEGAFPSIRDILADPQTGRYVEAPMVELEPGDVLVTSAAHSFGWRHGHAALVLSRDRVLQSFTAGHNSDIMGLDTSFGRELFALGPNFMVLRLKADAEERAAIADLAERELYNVPYSLTVGIFSPKDQGHAPKETHCSHLVWQAFRNAGYDVDFDGGPVATSRDLANSPFFDVVQIYGFDPLKGW